jgi:glycosyltransferase involved in cell wall biosynthesis
VVRGVAARPIRLLIASQPLDGGVARHVLDLVAALPRGAFTVDVACPPTSDVWKELCFRSDITLHPISAARAPSLGDLLTLVRLIPLVLRSDVVHAHSAKAGLLTRLAALLTGRRRRCFFSPHGWSFWAADGAMSRFYTLVERIASRWCYRIVAVSSAERDAGLDAHVGRPERYLVVPNGIDVDRFSAEAQPVRGRVVMVGRLATQKRPDLLVRAFAQVVPGISDAHLVLVGDGPLRDEVARLIEELGIEASVSLEGTRPDVPEILRAAACVVLASDYEGAPYALLEAMGAGATVVATNVGGIPDVVESGVSGLLVPAGDEELLAQAIKFVLEDPVRARVIGDEGRRVVRERFTREVMAQTLAAEYARAIGLQR